MQWKNVKLIFSRELRDQMRDRRTLFLIAVLPLLLYPLLGLSFLQMSQFLQSHPAKVLIVGDEQLAEAEWLPPLLENGGFAPSLFIGGEQQKSLEVLRLRELTPDAQEPEHKHLAVMLRQEGESPEVHAQRLYDSGYVQMVLEFPQGFVSGLQQGRQAVIDRDTDTAQEFPEPIWTYNSANDKSQAAQLRVERLLRIWRSKITQRNLAASNVPPEATQPFQFKPRDTAEASQKQVAVLSKILPFVLIIWALTGAFYPAVDLCAGEKERGTLETLLTSPALRREIVWGKLLTVMLFSSVTALLNMGTLGLTGKFVTAQLAANPTFGGMAQFSMPPLASLVWLVLSLIPISALFGALCLACAAFARSTKEGQYYLMPLMLVTMPLMLLPMSPGVELNLGNSLIPLTGLILLLRSCIEGQYAVAGLHLVPVLGVTSICCLLAIRWAEEQFSSESVLFRESERFELGSWLKSLVRDRQSTPTMAQAGLCIAITFMMQFFVTVAFASEGVSGSAYDLFVKSTLVMQIACFLLPALLMACLLTSNPAKSLLLAKLPKPVHVMAAAVLALLMHPVSVLMSTGISKLYPMSPDMVADLQQFQEVLFGGSNWWAPYLLIALLPAVCEELAFRGFILSGLRHFGRKWWAIGISAVAFGAVHLILQQKISAAVLGMVLGYVAVQTGSLIPCMVFHFFHNGLQIAAYQVAKNPGSSLAKWLGGDEPLLYQSHVVALCGAAAVAILWALGHANYRRSKEESLSEARHRNQGPRPSQDSLLGA